MFGSGGAGLRLFTFRGVPVELDIFAIFLIAIYAFSIGNGVGLGVGLAVSLGIFGSILVHEISHAVIGTWMGARVTGIKLNVLGGATYFASKPASYPKDMFISLAGPASNLILWQICDIAFKTLEQQSNFDSVEVLYILFYLSRANLFLGIFNALPAFPLDGGQALHALLMWITRREKLAAGVIMVLGVISAAGILYWYTNGFNIRSVGISLIFALFIAYWIASSSIALYRQAASPARPAPTPRQRAEMQQHEAERRAKSHPGTVVFEQGKTALLSHEYSQAIQKFSEALQIEPDEITYLDYRAYTFVQMGESSQALADYNRLLEIAPKRADFYTARAQVYFQIGNHEAARADVEQALNLNPTEGLALELKQKLVGVGG